MTAHPDMPLRAFFMNLHRRYALLAPPDFWGRGQQYSDWHYYGGSDCAPVNFYLRFGKKTLIVANMHGYAAPKGREKIKRNPLDRAGRMPVILNSLDNIAPRVVFESVINPFIGKYLTAHGFLPTDQQTYGCSFYKEFDVPPIEAASP